MTEFRVARNSFTSFYEVHAARCTHLSKRQMDTAAAVEAAHAAEAATKFEKANEGCVTRVKACAKGRKR